MRQLNVRLLLIVSVLSSLLAVGVYSLHKHQVRRHAGVFLERARQARADGRLVEAVGLAQQYVSLRPGDVDGLVDYGSMLAEIREYRQAYLIYDQVLRRDPNRHEVRREMVDISINMRLYTDAIDHIRSLQSPSTPPDAVLLALLGRCHRALGEYEKAKDAYQQAIECGCEPEVYEEFARMLQVQLDRPDQAWTEIDRVVEDYPEDYRSYVIRGNWHLQQAELIGVSRPTGMAESSAWADALSAFRLNQREPDVVWLLARAAKSPDQVSQAREHLQAAISQNPPTEAKYAAAAELEIRHGSPEVAIELLQRGLRELPESPDLLWNLASLQLEQGDIDEVKRATASLKRAGYPAEPLAYLDARILISGQNWDHALQTLSGIQLDSSNLTEFERQIDYWLGICHRNLGNHDQAATAFRRAISSDLFWIPAREGLAATHLSKGDLDSALNEYWQLSRLPDAPPSSQLKWAQLQILTNLQHETSDQDWQDLEQLLSQMEQQLPDLIEVPILRAEMEFLRGNQDAAVQHLSSAITRHPDQQRLRLAQIALLTRFNNQDWTRIDELLQETRKMHGDTVALRLVEANALVARNNTDLAQKLDELADAPDGWSPEDQTTLAAELARIHFSIGNEEAAQTYAERVANDEKENLLIRLLIFDLAFRRKDESGLDQVLDEIEEIEGQGPFWRYGKAVQLVLRAEVQDDDSYLADAMDYLFETNTLRPFWSRVPWLMGEILQRQGDETAAIERYKEAVKLGERRPEAIAQAASLLYRHGRFIEADQILERLREQEHQRPFSPQLNRLEAEISLRLNEGARALELAIEAAQEKASADNQLWLGHVQEINENDAEAEAAFRHAISLEPAESQYWLALIRFLSRRGEISRAEEIISEAQATIEADQRALFNAQCFESLEQFDTAQQHYRQALQQSPRDPLVLRSAATFYLRQRSFDQAEPFLETLASDDVSADAEDRAWANRIRALGVSDRGGHQSFKDAQALIRTNLERNPDSFADKRARAIICATQPTRSARQEAIRQFEELQSHGSLLSDDDLFLLAQLYFTENNRIRGNQLMHTLLGRKSSNKVKIIPAYVTILLQRGEYTEAELWLSRLQDLAPNERATEDLRLQLLFRKGEYDDVYVALTGPLAKAPTDPAGESDDPQVEDVQRHAAWLEVFSASLKSEQKPQEAQRFSQAAESFYKQLRARQPEHAHLLAGYFARQEDVDQALHVLQESQTSGQLPTDELIAIARRLLIQASVSQQVQLQSILESAVENNEQHTGLTLLLADFHSWRENVDAAERFYHQVLHYEAENTQALNNLAMMIALAQSKTDEAMELINTAIDLAGETGSLLDTRGVVHLIAGDVAAALADFDRAIAEQESIDRHFHRSEALLALERVPEATEAFSRANELGLAPERLHPLERPQYERLQRQLHTASN